MKKILFTILIPFNLVCQTQPAPPPPAESPPPTQDFGTTQNNINGTQGRSFGGGSIVRPKSISIYNDLNTTTGLEITETIRYNNWFYTYNETQNSMELHIF